MSDMTEMMTKQMFLEVCIEIEGLCADLYHYYSDLFIGNSYVSGVWKKTALEEENHQKQFCLAFRLVNRTTFEVLKDSLRQAYSVHHYLMKLIEHVKINKPDLLTAIENAVNMEEKIACLHVNSSLNFKEAEVQNLFRVLSEADQGHIEELKRCWMIMNLSRHEMNTSLQNIAKELRHD